MTGDVLAPLAMPQPGPVSDPVPTVRVAIDSSSDGKRAAYACLVVAPGEKPRLIYGQAWHVPADKVEAWEFGAPSDVSTSAIASVADC